jgi:hypothetical protein
MPLSPIVHSGARAALGASLSEVRSGFRSASATRSVRMWSAIDQPTALRLKQPCAVAR